MRKGNKYNHLSFSPKAAAMWAKIDFDENKAKDDRDEETKKKVCQVHLSVN